MAEVTLEDRLARIEQKLADVERKVDTLVGGPSPNSRWWENLGPPMTEEERREWDEAAPRRAYIRQTGQCPPPDWKPGDPIPEPDWWQ
jgi:hypothetical protein